MKNVGIALAVVIVGAGVLVGGYLGGWWIKEDSVNRTSQINNDSYARQLSLTTKIIDLHTQVGDLDVRVAGDVTEDQRTAILTNRASLVVNLCESYDQITGTTTLPKNIHAFAAQEC